MCTSHLKTEYRQSAYISTDTRPICRPTYWRILGGHVVSVDTNRIVTDRGIGLSLVPRKVVNYHRV